MKKPLELMTPEEGEEAGIRDSEYEGGNFSYRAWEQGDKDGEPEEHRRRITEFPPRSDSYRQGQTAWGKDPKRGRAIMRGRERRRMRTNWHFFLLHVLPVIREWLNPQAWHEIGMDAPQGTKIHQRDWFFQQGGWELIDLGPRIGSYWAHPLCTPYRHSILKALLEHRPVNGKVNPNFLPEGYVLDPETSIYIWSNPK